MKLSKYYKIIILSIIIFIFLWMISDYIHHYIHHYTTEEFTENKTEVNIILVSVNKFQEYINQYQTIIAIRA